MNTSILALRQALCCLLGLTDHRASRELARLNKATPRAKAEAA